jgi:hypothetical protein
MRRKHKFLSNYYTFKSSTTVILVKPTPSERGGGGVGGEVSERASGKLRLYKDEVFKVKPKAL